jgi:hypothetical protein
VGGRARKRSRVGLGVAASVLVHLAMAGLVILSLPRQGPPAEPQPIVVTLSPQRLLVRPEAPRRPAARASARSPSPAPPIPLPSRAAAAPSPALPALQAPNPGADQEGLARAKGALRGSLGCEDAAFLHLTVQELEHCNRWRQARVIPEGAIPAAIAPEKRAWFEAALAARNSPGHPPGFVCGVLIDGIRLVKAKTPPNAVKLGPLPCFVMPPKGPLSEEADVQTPSRQTVNGKPLDYTPNGIFITSDKGIAP